MSADTALRFAALLMVATVAPAVAGLVLGRRHAAEDPWPPPLAPGPGDDVGSFADVDERQDDGTEPGS